jgi:hypothetical protein
MKLMSPALSRRALMAGLGAAALPAQAQPRTGTRPQALAYLELQKRSIRWLLKDLW